MRMATCDVKELHAISARAIDPPRSLEAHVRSGGVAALRMVEQTRYMHELVRIAVTDATRPGVEQVPARRVGDNEWQLLRSPLYATEVASGDVIRVINHDSGEFEIVVRGGNVCVQFYLGESDVDDAEATTRIAKAVARDIEPLGGSIDAQTPGLIAFTIPVGVGFPAIERVFAAAAGQYTGAEWQYSNVYDPETGDPLGWWE